MDQPLFLKLFYIGVVLLVCLIPAYLLYRTLPADAQAKGTLKGIRFKLGGAFAGYFVLVLTILVLLPPEPRPPQEEQVWTLYADYGFSDDAGSPQLLTVQTIPRNPTPTEDGRLRYKLVGSNQNGEWRFPDLRIGHENYITESILLDKYSRKEDSIRINREQKTIHITKPIILEKAGVQ